MQSCNGNGDAGTVTVHGTEPVSAAGHEFAEDLRDVCKGEAVPPDAVAVMRSSDGRNGSSKKLPYLAFLVPERGRYLWMRSWEAWGLRKCSLCGVLSHPPPCGDTAYACALCRNTESRDTPCSFVARVSGDVQSTNGRTASSASTL